MKRLIYIILSLGVSLVACDTPTSPTMDSHTPTNHTSDQDFDRDFDQDFNQDLKSPSDQQRAVIDYALDLGGVLSSPTDAGVGGSGDDEPDLTSEPPAAGTGLPGDSPEDSTDFSMGMTSHLTQWLEGQTDERASQVGFNIASLARPDLSGGSFGGLIDEIDRARYQPVIFVHGNSDRAWGGELGGWSATVRHLQTLGYRSAELYATTYGPARSDRALTADYQHTVENVLRIRLMIELTISYTGARRVNVITHSLGTTIARRALLGGVIEDSSHRVDLGPPLTDMISTFISIAGAHWGLSGCYLSVNPVCSADLGLYPGQLTPLGVIGRSTILETINTARGYEGRRRVSVWGPDDELVGGRCLVWGVNTCQLPSATDDYRLPGYTHLGLRNQTVALQAELLARSL